ALNEVDHRGDVDPAPIRRSDRIAGVDRLWLESPACKPAGGCARGQAESGHERGAPREPFFALGLFERPRQPLAKRGMDTLRTLPDAGQPGRRRDRGLLLRVPAAKLEAAASEEVRDDLLDTVLSLAVHSGRTFAAARSARSCITLMAPTVDFISLATSFNEYPCRKRSSKTRR